MTGTGISVRAISAGLPTVVAGLLLSSTALAQNDECVGAIAVGAGTTPFDTTGATTSLPPWPCASGSNDLWYTYTTVGTDTLRITLCGSGYDTTLEVFTGTCGALTSIACNDDAPGFTCGPGFHSGLAIPGLAAGTTVTFRVGGFINEFGPGLINIDEIVPPPAAPPITDNCLETLFASNNGGSRGGAVYFDLTVTQNVSFAGLFTNMSALVGDPVGLEVFTIPGTYMGAEGTPGAWTFVARDDGTATSAGDDIPTPITFAAPFSLTPGTYGIALVGENTVTGLTADHDYTNGTGGPPGGNQNAASVDGVLSAVLGSASNVPFDGAPFFPRVWNGRLCTGMGVPGPIGTADPLCSPLSNSTGFPSSLSLVGTGNAGDPVTASVSGGPPTQFGYHISGPNPGLYSPVPGSSGIICIGNPQFRYNSVVLGHIFQFDAAGDAMSVELQTDGSFGGVPAIMVGESRAFQAWHRDDPMTSNFSDSLIHTFN